MSHKNNELYAEGEVDDDVFEEKSVEVTCNEDGSHSSVNNDFTRSIRIEEMSFAVVDDKPTATLKGVEIAGIFKKQKNPLYALLENFADDTDL